MTCLSILSVMINYGMLVFGVTESSSPGMTAHYGAVAVGEPDDGELAACRLLGRKLVQHVQRIHPG
jgi:NAD(P)H dehydrogenase (quinone)